MKKPSTLFVITCILFFKLNAAAPGNDDCANATLLTVSSTCTTVTGTLVGATNSISTPTNTCGTIRKEVWYKFVATTSNPTITVKNLGSNIVGAGGVVVQLLQGSCGSFSNAPNTNCASGTTTATLSASGLSVGTTYYVIVYTKNNSTPLNNANFDICVTALPLSRMSEVWQRTVLSSGTISTPWEVTYGPDGYLWVTASQDYKVYRVDPNTPNSKTQILDLSSTSTDFPSIKAQFAYSSVSPKPQGGLAGLAIHPEFNSGKPYVYISYVRKLDSASVLNSGCGYFKNSIVRFTYSAGTLGSPVVLVDTLPGGNDHNSQRMIIAPVNGTYYLFYGQGDMGAGQLACQWRPNHAQNKDDYEGKILRFNLEPDGDGGTYDKWIPNDNPYNATLGKQSAVWAMGIRNNQGFAYDTTLGTLYASQHGPYSDDEINIIEKGMNYGHPYVIGYSWDGNYNGANAGSPNTLSTLDVITDEAAAAAAIPNYKDPLFSGYPSGGPTYPVNFRTPKKIWDDGGPSNGSWPSEAWSGIDFYNNKVIPGWKNSLLICGLKWGRVLRLKVGPAGNTIVSTDGADTVAYFQAKNRYRDLAIDPDGRTLYISNEGTSAGGPGGVAPPSTVPSCTNCIIKYTFLGYADAGGKSTIPDAIDVTDATVNTVDSATTVTIDNTNNMLWVPITGPDGNIMAEIYANGNNLGVVHSAFYKHSGSIRVKGGIHYLNRNITITPENQPDPSKPVKVRFYISKAEYDALDADGASGISAIGDLKILTNEDVCRSSIATSTTLINPTFAEAHGTNGYVLQGNVTGFSSFYFASGNITLPVNLVSFKGSLQSNGTLLEWETANEVNTSQFALERSLDGQNFKQIGTVAAAGNDGKNKYSYTDNEAMQQSSLVLYYRLKMIDKDGSFTYSDVVTITLPSVTGKISVFPNPARKEIKVTVAVPADGKVKWNITDNTGRIVLQNSISLKKGNNSTQINVSNLSGGIYYLNMSGAGINQKIKFEKL